jgi:hypothetical protein
MSPKELALGLKRIAAALESSKTPRRDLVLSDLRRMVAALASDVVITAVQRVGGSDAYPDFHVTGTFRGQPFVRKISLEIAGHDMESEHVSGFNLDDLREDLDFDMFTVEEPMLNAIYSSKDYVDCVNASSVSEDTTLETDGSGFDVILTNDEHVGDGTGRKGKALVNNMIRHLKASPRNAIEILGEVAVWRGAGGDDSNYYYQSLPLTDPNDAEGGDLTAEQAVVEALRSISMM